jgi:hypothetical protein
MALIVAVVAIAGFGLVATGCGDDDDTVPACTQAACTAGSTVCCSGARPGTWNASLRLCACPGADADADVGADADADIGADADADMGADADVGADADTDVRPDTGTCTPDFPGGVCNVVFQCGCGAGERCVLDSETGRPPYTEACTTAGTDPIDTVCPSGADNCSPGMQCFGDGTTFECQQFCYEATDCPGGRPCLGAFDPVGFCGPPPTACNLVTAAECDAGETCVITESAACDRMCIGAGDATLGEVCEYSNSCVPGLGCYSFDSGTTYTCTPYCTSAGTECTAAGTACNMDLSPGCPEFGVCAPTGG